MRFLSLVAAVPFSLLLACSPVSAAPAGDVAGTPAARLTGGELAALRAEGPAALDRLLARYDALAATDDAGRRALAATIDKVAGQRYATSSRLYWYEDLELAKAAARASGKPILSLRMLGRLDEDLSCANSRFFRTTLYPDARVAALLREHFILHWSSERDVPRITVDFGDGRKLESTVTGNSAHYVLDAAGRPLDVLPGLYAPEVFVRELRISRELHASLRGLDERASAERLYQHHRTQLDLTSTRFAALPQIPIIVGARALMNDATVMGAAADAQAATMSKRYIEVPMLRTVELGVDPGKLPDDVELWAEIGQHLLKVGSPPDARRAAEVAGGMGTLVIPADAFEYVRTGDVMERRPKVAPRRILDPNARALVDAMLAEPAAGQALDERARAAVIARLEQTIVADTALNEVRLRPQIRTHLLGVYAHGLADFAPLNRHIYDHVFHTPAADAWMGLLPRDTFTGLPAGAVIGRTRS